VKAGLVYRVNVAICLILWKLLGNRIEKLNNAKQRESHISSRLKHCLVVVEKSTEHQFN